MYRIYQLTLQDAPLSSAYWLVSAGVFPAAYVDFSICHVLCIAFPVMHPVSSYIHLNSPSPGLFSGAVADSSSGVWQEGGDDEETEEPEVDSEAKGQS